MLKRWIKGFQQVALMLARIAAGVILVARGWYRWFICGIDQQAAILEASGIPAPDLAAWLVTLFELAGGVLLTFGLFTPLVGFGMLVLNLGIMVLRKLDALYIHDGGYEYNLALAALGILFFAFGAGKLGADSLFFTPKEPSGNDANAPASTPPPPPEPSEKTLYSQHRHS